jgi:hypothetical protein
MSHSPLRATWKSQTAACFAVLTLVFLCGAVVGALAMNLGVHNRLHKSAFWTEPGKAAYLAKVQKELDLSPTQTEQMKSILDDFSQYYRTVLSDGRDRILQILNDDQKHKFERLLQESQHQ